MLVPSATFIFSTLYTHPNSPSVPC